MLGCCLLTARGFRRCLTVDDLSDVVGDNFFDLVFCVTSPGVASFTLGSDALGCTLKAVAFLC